jgi:hypothetical protein
MIRLAFSCLVLAMGCFLPTALFGQLQGFALAYETVWAESGQTRTVTVSVTPDFVRLDIDGNALALTLAYDRQSHTITDWDRRRDRRRVISAEELPAFREKGRRYADQMRESAEKAQNGTPEQTLYALQRRNPSSPIFWRFAPSVPAPGAVKVDDRNCQVFTATDHGHTAIRFWSTPVKELGLGSAEAAVLAEWQEILSDAGLAFNGFRLSDAFFGEKGSDLLVAKSECWLEDRVETTTSLRSMERRTFGPEWFKAEK